ncbi:MAG: cofactor-independent phosphoglycerate mutase [Dorea sp.]|jgi:2,3-bisphosphoglycerate-independent phosphoglycerate mutase|nr:cofactor-independent phosphoglycerate mutase [Dorea sp.]MCI9248251.1 cofactor-independent phosphoglycerate mutase [Dorea sp.]
MKYLVILSDGMAGKPLDSLGKKTTLEAAYVPEMDRLAAVSEVGMASMVPEGMAPGSDTANLAVMGYDPKVYYTGRSPLEALSIGVDMKKTDVSYRCNLVTLSEEDCAYEDRQIIDHSSDEISTEEAAVLIEALKEGLGRKGYLFYAGTSYRHLLVQENGTETELVPPHDILTRRIGEYLPGDPILRDMMRESYGILKNHPVNEERRKKGLHPANSAWFWGAGKKPALDSFEERTGKRGIMISAVDLLKGIAVGAGMDCASVKGANGGLHTNYRGKAQAAVQALAYDGYDFAYIHIEAPDEMGHQGNAADKIAAIENIDEKVLKTVICGLEEAGEEYRLLLLPDHPTPVAERTHTGEAVPYLLYDNTAEEKGPKTFSEKTAAESGNVWADGYKLMSHFLQEEIC